MKINILQLELADMYDQFLLRHHGSLFYYSSKYKDFLKTLLGCEEEYLLAMEGGKIRGILPLMYTRGPNGRIYNSLPYYGSHGGIIADNPTAYQKLVTAYNAIASSRKTITSTIVSSPFTHQDASEILYNHTDYRIGQFTDIAGIPQINPWDTLMERIDASARRNVKKAMRAGVTVESDYTQMERLRQMHQDNIRAIGGMPKTDEFFTSVPRHFTPNRDFDLYVAKKDGAVIAGLLIFYFNQTVEYFTPAIEHEYRPMQPLSLILITAMADASRRGFVRWNWGGTWASQTGVHRFKKKWAAMEKPYHYYTQLNDRSILDWSPVEILNTFPHFFVVPFAAIGRNQETSFCYDIVEGDKT